MATTVNLKRKNIDLPLDTLQKLSLLAISQGKSLKRYIESLLIAKAESVSVEINENPSPTGDEWFNDPENTDSIKRGISEFEAGKGRVYTTDEIKSLLGL